MPDSVTCDCGATLSVRQGMAGIAIQCPECGERIEVPSRRELASESASGRSSDHRSADDRPERIIPESIYAHFCGEVGSQGQISNSALENYAGLVVVQVDRWVASLPDDVRFELMISCALFPQERTLIAAETRPRDFEEESVACLVDAVNQIPVPPVSGGPVAFVLYRRSAAHPVRRMGTRPFPDLTSQIQTDGAEVALTRAIEPTAGEPSSHRTNDPSPVRQSFWSRVKQFLFADRRPHSVAPTITSVDPDPPVSEYQRMKARVEAIEQKFADTSTELLLQALEQEPEHRDLWIALAAKHVSAHDFSGAAQAYGQALRLDPDNAPVVARRAGVSLADDQLQNALSDWNRAIELAPDEPWFYLHRSRIFAELEAEQQVTEDLDRACSLAPREPMFLLTRGVKRIGQGDLEGARLDLERVVRLDPNSGRGHEHLGWIHLQSEFNDLNVAVEHLGRAIELMPQALDARIHRSLAFAAQNKFELALQDCEFVTQSAPDNGAGFGAKGRVLQMSGEFERAIEACTRAIELGLEVPMVYLSRGFSYAATDQVESAVMDCEAALELEPGNPLAFQLRGMLSIELGELDAAMEALMKARDAAPEWPEPREHIALLHRMNENPEAAVEEQSILIDNQPDHAGHFVNRAFAYAQSGDYKAARQDYDQACQLEPENEQILYLRGCFLMDREEHGSALDDFDRVLELTGDNDDARFRRAALLLRLKRQDEAVVEFEKLVTKHPENPEFYSGRAYAHQLAGNEDLAEADLERAKEIAPEKSVATSVQMLCGKFSRLQRAEEYDEAIQVAEEVIELAPDEATGYQLRGCILWYSEQYVEALEDYSHALEIDPGDTALLSARGQVYAEMGEWDAAFDDLNRAIDQSREEGQSRMLAYGLNGRSFALAATGNLDDSAKDYQESVRLCPENAWAYYHRGVILFRCGDLGEAKSMLDRAMKCEDPPLSPRKQERTRAILAQL